MSISLNELKHMADLARLRLSESELLAMHSDLNRVLDHFRQIQELDMAGIEVNPHAVDVNSIWADDTVAPSMRRADALAGAPKTSAGLFLVPTIID